MVAFLPFFFPPPPFVVRNSLVLVGDWDGAASSDQFVRLHLAHAVFVTGEGQLKVTHISIVVLLSKEKTMQSKEQQLKTGPVSYRLLMWRKKKISGVQATRL